MQNKSSLQPLSLMKSSPSYIPFSPSNLICLHSTGTIWRQFSQNTSRGHPNPSKQENTTLKGIIDLRGNPGGNVLEGVQLTDWFLASGPITTLSYRDSTANQTHSAVHSLRTCWIVNWLSSSMEIRHLELVAGALQEADPARMELQVIQRFCSKDVYVRK